MASVQATGMGHVFMLDSNREGPAVIRNRIMEGVFSEFALFLDDDDVLEPNYADIVAPHLDDHDVVYTWCHRPGWEADLDREFDPEILRGANFIPVTACVRVSMFREAGGFPEGVAYEDWALWLKLLDMGARFKCVPEKAWSYRRHADSRTHTNQVLVSTGKVPAA